MKFTFTTCAAVLGLAFGSAAFAATGPEVIEAQKCGKCHTAKTTKKGPSFADVAAKYAGKPDAADKLFKGLKAGGKMGDEEDHKQLKVSDEEIKAVVATVLASK